MVSEGPDQEKSNKAIRYILNRLNKELKEDLFYHGIHHTIDVMNACKEILKYENSVSEEDANVLFVAAAYHDCGFLNTYRNHEEAGCEIARSFLTEIQFDENKIDQIEKIIMSTKLPQSADNKLEQILCDADLDYLGGDKFDEISDSLRREFLTYGIIDESVNWTDFQLDFFDNHHYWTDYAIRYRKPGKDAVIERLKSES
ncbi:MAG: HD domain-containing protein [Bacteroidota bacterium]